MQLARCSHLSPSQEFSPEFQHKTCQACVLPAGGSTGAAHQWWTISGAGWRPHQAPRSLPIPLECHSSSCSPGTASAPSIPRQPGQTGKPRQTSPSPAWLPRPAGRSSELGEGLPPHSGAEGLPPCPSAPSRCHPAPPNSAAGTAPRSRPSRPPCVSWTTKPRRQPLPRGGAGEGDPEGPVPGRGGEGVEGGGDGTRGPAAPGRRGPPAGSRPPALTLPAERLGGYFCPVFPSRFLNREGRIPCAQ